MDNNLIYTFVKLSMLSKSVKSIFLIGIILLLRKWLNRRSLKWACMILWVILVIYLFFPYSVMIRVRDMEQLGISKAFWELMILTEGYISAVTHYLGGIFFKFNRFFIAGLFFLYIVFQFVTMNRLLKDSAIVEKDDRMNDCLNLFKLKRKIEILVNDEAKVPITYGLIKPKIIIQSHILEDSELLRYVLIHELTHIRKYDIVWKYLKALTMCLYWYNIFVWTAVKCIEEDIEILCDKLVIQKVGNTVTNRKEYCMSMLKLIEYSEGKNRNHMGLRLHPTIERIMIMKKWRRTVFGVIIFVLLTFFSITVFATVRFFDTNIVTSSAPPSDGTHINEENCVRIITDEEYEKMSLKDINSHKINSANIYDRVTLKGLANKKYSFDMSSWGGREHTGFTIKMSELSSKRKIDYAIIIEKDEEVIYQESFDGDITLAVKAHTGSSYSVIIGNHSVKTLKYKIKINSVK